MVFSRIAAKYSREYGTRQTADDGIIFIWRFYNVSLKTTSERLQYVVWAKVRMGTTLTEKEPVNEQRLSGEKSLSRTAVLRRAVQKRCGSQKKRRQMLRNAVKSRAVVVAA